MLIYNSISLLLLLLCNICQSYHTLYHNHKKPLFPLKAINLPSEGSKKLYNDQMEAWARRSELEHQLLPKGSELLSIKLKKANIPSGTGFSSKSLETSGPQVSISKQYVDVLKKDGVVRINKCLKQQTCSKVREYVLIEQAKAKQDVIDGKSLAQTRFGVEIERKFRSDLLLSLLKPENKDLGHPVVEALNELLGRSGSMRSLYEQLVTVEGEFYELAATITDPGSERQMLHPDLPFNEIPPLYVVFVALQDITMSMGPTTFLLGTQTKSIIDRWNHNDKDQIIKQSNPKYALLQTGDAVVFDARVIHCGNANDPIKGSTRALFNFSFRNPLVVGDLGYKGSIRPKYESKFKLIDIFNKLNDFDKLVADPFNSYGDGLDS